MKYVLGFVLVGNNYILLQLKNRGNSYINGKLNGLGGKIEPTDADVVAAMHREYFEETGQTERLGWHHFSTFYYENGVELNVLYARVPFRYYDDVVWSSEDENAEELFIVDIRDMENLNCVDNLKYIIPLLLDN